MFSDVKRRSSQEFIAPIVNRCRQCRNITLITLVVLSIITLGIAIIASLVNLGVITEASKLYVFHHIGQATSAIMLGVSLLSTVFFGFICLRSLTRL